MSSQNPRVRPEESGVVQALEARDLTLAEALGKYRLLGALGHGGMADVYLAVADGPEGFRKLCVLKLLKDSMAQDEDFRAMFLDEARLAARLNHPNVVQTFEVGETHGRLMIAMEYVEGQPATRVRRRLAPEQFPLTAYISVLCDVLDALEYAHGLTDFDGSRLGIVHRDVSPHNIIIGYDARVKLVDFGIAKSSAAMQETQAGVLKGKVGYMAPEQASMRDVDGRADVFSVGVILWEAIAGRRLAEGMSAQDVLVRRVEGNDPKIAAVVPSVDPELAAICDRAMARFPEQRHGSAAELQSELEAWLKKRTELNRKELSRALRDAFAAEREQLRSLVEQRMADSAMSGMRQALLGSPGLPSVARLHNSGEMPSVTPARLAPPPAPPSSGSQLATGPVALAGPRGTLPVLEQPNSSFAVRTMSVTPQAGRSGVPGYVILGIGGLVVLGGIAVAAVVAKSGSASPVTDVPSAAAARQSAPPDSAKTATPGAPVDSPSTSPASPSTSASSTTVARPGRPVFVPPPAGNRAPPPVAHTPATTPATAAPTTPTGLTSPVPPKQPARPLDEKDPYAP
jgi:serine/threonine-protein kinase